MPLSWDASDRMAGGNVRIWPSFGSTNQSRVDAVGCPTCWCAFGNARFNKARENAMVGSPGQVPSFHAGPSMHRSDRRVVVAEFSAAAIQRGKTTKEPCQTN